MFNVTCISGVETVSKPQDKQHLSKRTDGHLLLSSGLFTSGNGLSWMG